MHEWQKGPSNKPRPHRIGGGLGSRSVQLDWVLLGFNCSSLPVAVSQKARPHFRGKRSPDGLEA